MSQPEQVLKKSAGVKVYEGESLKVGHGLSYSLGSLVLTNQRLAFLRSGGKGATFTGIALLGVPGMYMAEKLASRDKGIEEGLKNPGSFEIPLSEVIEAKAGRSLGSACLVIKYRTPAGEKANTFLWGSGIIGKKDWEEAIAAAKTQFASDKTSPSAWAQRSMEPTSNKYCINCGAEIPTEVKYCPRCGGKQED